MLIRAGAPGWEASGQGQGSDGALRTVPPVPAGHWGVPVHRTRWHMGAVGVHEPLRSTLLGQCLLLNVGHWHHWTRHHQTSEPWTRHLQALHHGARHQRAISRPSPRTSLSQLRKPSRKLCPSAAVPRGPAGRSAGLSPDLGPSPGRAQTGLGNAAPAARGDPPPHARPRGCLLQLQAGIPAGDTPACVLPSSWSAPGSAWSGPGAGGCWACCDPLPGDALQEWIHGAPGDVLVPALGLGLQA